MKKVADSNESNSMEAFPREPEPKGRDQRDPCDKSFHPETARLNDADEACNDGVK